MTGTPLRNIFYAVLPKPEARDQRKGRRSPVRRLLVLSNGPNPTFTYYLAERLKYTPFIADVRNLGDGLTDIDPDGLFVIVCRYIRLRQLFWLFRNRKALAGTSLLIDDDIAATIVSKGGTLAYKAYLTALGIAPLLLLNHILSEVWVSTPVLAETLGRNKTSSPIVVPPYPSRDVYTPAFPSKDRQTLVMAFHATGNHDREHEFLVPIVRDALTECPNLYFEVTVSGHKLEQLWVAAGLPRDRLRLEPSKSWKEYLYETKRRQVDIMLVPLLQNKMNDARSSTKRFDVARMGAAAIFSRGHVYGQPSGGDEIFVDNDYHAWVGAILSLAGNAELRHHARKATRAAIKNCLAKTPHGLPLGADKQKF
ncbi:hypothetical protein N5C66_22660 [Rhizobium pusense]|uniref:hypothetical protein n=1 Tax=Agrobacterium pusense TaxID=648995 RepID=UPI000D1B5BB5|nr:hypothetical protein [Agrobacterium pusense]MDH0910461.1 hypothetical protein [Agrobacterium pusense]MDH1098424.1 hypothetical protein [Agrobacterium pusense]MDH1114534.1 hypothetical protein [Agrobacterium pusense]MDH2195702.1 hypothetical protein [Agrobacterium pusense]